MADAGRRPPEDEHESSGTPAPRADDAVQGTRTGLRGLAGAAWSSVSGRAGDAAASAGAATERAAEELDHATFAPTPPPQSEPPERWWGRHLAELRWQAELARLLVDPIYRGEGVPRGNATPVLCIPGFLAGDSSLAVMRGWLARIGHVPIASGITVNVDCSDRALERLDRRLLAVHERTGRQVALVGHSRGGHFAKALAHRRPELVSGVVSIGAGLDTPFDISVPTQAAVAAFRGLHAATTDRVARRGCFTDACSCGFALDYTGAFPASVPLTSIYSRGDGVVRWPACIVDYADCVEVTGSHVGLAFNRKVYRVLGQRLAARATASAA